MGYKARPWFPGAILHITARGNHRNDIFRDEEDFEVYCAHLEGALKHFKGKFHVYSYCLMDNHIHLLVKTEDMHICNFITRVNSIYANFFNKKYKYVGHLYQDRYFTELIESDAQLLSASRYIHLNPIRARMVKKPEEYQWSSYSMFLGSTRERNVDCEKILKYFGPENNRENYREFVEAGIKEEDKEKVASEESMEVLNR